MKFGHYTNAELGIRRNLTCAMFDSKGVGLNAECSDIDKKHAIENLDDALTLLYGMVRGFVNDNDNGYDLTFKDNPLKPHLQRSRQFLNKLIDERVKKYATTPELRARADKWLAKHRDILMRTYLDSIVCGKLRWIQKSLSKAERSNDSGERDKILRDFRDVLNSGIKFGSKAKGLIQEIYKFRDGKDMSNNIDEAKDVECAKGDNYKDRYKAYLYDFLQVGEYKNMKEFAKWCRDVVIDEIQRHPRKYKNVKVTKKLAQEILKKKEPNTDLKEFLNVLINGSRAYEQDDKSMLKKGAKQIVDEFWKAFEANMPYIQKVVGSESVDKNRIQHAVKQFSTDVEDEVRYFAEQASSHNWTGDVKKVIAASKRLINEFMEDVDDPDHDAEQKACDAWLKQNKDRLFRMAVGGHAECRIKDIKWNMGLILARFANGVENKLDQAEKMSREFDAIMKKGYIFPNPNYAKKCADEIKKMQKQLADAKRKKK